MMTRELAGQLSIQIHKSTYVTHLLLLGGSLFLGSGLLLHMLYKSRNKKRERDGEIRSHEAWEPGPAGMLARSTKTIQTMAVWYLAFDCTHGGGLLDLGRELEGALDLDEVTGGDHVLEDLEEHAVGKGLALVVGLDVLLDGLTGGAGAVLEVGDSGDDSCLVHGWIGWIKKCKLQTGGWRMEI